MTPERWRQISELLAAALELAPDQRPPFLDEQCGDDDQLRSEVAAWLSSLDRAGDLLDAPAAEVIAKDIAKRYARTKLEVGQQLDHHKIVGLLGKGGFGEVYKAYDTQLKRDVAIKVFSSIDSNEDGLLRFKQEAYAASRLKHPNIITVHAIGEIGSTPFIVTELVEGITLRERINQSPLSPPEALAIAVQLAHALTKAHQAGVIHRDIKPENIMLGDDGVVKILDFGVAKFTGQDMADSESQKRMLVQTKTGTVIGSVRYMSPEQLLAEEVDERSDIWSLGVVFYEMIAGKVPFEGRTESMVSHKVLSEEPAPLTRYSSAVTPDMDRIVSKSLRKDRAARFKSMSDLFLEFDGVKKQLEVETFLRTQQEREEAQTRETPPEEITQEAASTSLTVIREAPSRPGELVDAGAASTPHEEGPEPIVETARPEASASENAQEFFSSRPDTSASSDEVGHAASNLWHVPLIFVRRFFRHRVARAAVILLVLSVLIMLGFSRLGVDEPRDTNENLNGNAAPQTVNEVTTHGPPVASDNKVDAGRGGLSQNKSQNQNRRSPLFNLRQSLEGQHGTVWSVAASPDDKWVASGSKDGKVRIWDAHTWKLKSILYSAAADVTSVAFSPDSKVVASGNRDGTLNVWDVSQGKRLNGLRGHRQMIDCIVFAPTDNLLASVSKDKTIKLWDTLTWQTVSTLRGHEDVVWAAAFSPDGKVLATASKDRTIRLWDVASGRIIETLNGHTRAVVALAFSPDGRLLASGSDDNTIKLWDMRTRLEVRTLTGHEAYITSLAFSPDSNYLVSASWDKTLRLWDVQTGRLLQTLTQDGGEVTCVRFLDEGSLLISSDKDGAVRVWQSSEE